MDLSQDSQIPDGQVDTSQPEKESFSRDGKVNDDGGNNLGGSLNDPTSSTPKSTQDSTLGEEGESKSDDEMDEDPEEIFRRRTQKKQRHHKILDQAAKWTRELEVERDRMYRVSLLNAITLDFLAMQGLDEKVGNDQE